MQLMILSAFALVLWLNPRYQPYLSMSTGRPTLMLALIHPIIAWVAAHLVSRWSLRRLAADPTHPERGQRLLGRGGVVTSTLVIGGFLGLVFVTDWVPLVRTNWILDRIYGLDELCILAPFLAALVVVWLGLYPADRAIRKLTMEARLWEALPTHPVWSRGQYLVFHLRHHLLIVMAPMGLVLVAFDATRAYGDWLRDKTGIFWAADGALGIVAGIIFFFLPVMLARVWSTEQLGDGTLRRRLQELCRRMGLRYRRILIWNTGGQVVNAAVTGLLAPVRYIMLSDGLLETVEHEKIEAVFGHEAGHVKHHHIFFFLLFAILSMCLAGGLTLAAVYLDWVGARDTQTQQTIILVSLGMFWGFGFGWVSRRFEQQADLFAVRCVTPDISECPPGCRVHGADHARSGARDGVASSAVCATAVSLFADALSQIADLNGIPAEARSWRHSSIASRIAQLRRFAEDPSTAASFDRKLRIIKVALLVATTVACSIAAKIYWPW
jgi:STE24 endopeptidase